MVKAVIFDMDGVLIDTERWLNKYWCQAAREAGFDMQPEQALLIRSLAGKYAKPFLRDMFGPEFDYHTIRERRKVLMRQHIEKYGIDKKPGADEVLDYLRDKRIKTAVATATDYDRAVLYLKQIKILDKFDRIISVSMVENGKPSPDVYLYACKEIGESPEECIAVEDSPNGVRAAFDAGLKTIMVPDLTRADEETEKMIIAEMDTLHGVIRMMEEGDTFINLPCEST